MTDSPRPWNVCADCLTPLVADLTAIRDRWLYPPQEEIDDERPDADEIHAARIHATFDPRRIDAVFQRHDFVRAVLWAKLNAAGLAGDLEASHAELIRSLDEAIAADSPLEFRIVDLANTIENIARIAEQFADSERQRAEASPSAGDIKAMLAAAVAQIVEANPKTESPDVWTPLQISILKALDGQALKKQALANAVCGGEGSRLYKTGGIKELRAAGRVELKHGLGFYRPDAPPPDPTRLKT